MRGHFSLVALFALLLAQQGCMQGDTPTAPKPSATLHLVGTIGGASSIDHIRFSPNGAWIATASEKENQGVTLWSAFRLKSAWRRTAGFRQSIRSLEFSHDGSMIATGNRYIDATSYTVTVAYVWNTTSGDMVSHCTQLDGTTEALAFIPGDSVLATSGSEINEVKLWNPYTGKEIGKVDQSANVTLTFSPDGRYLVGSAGTLIDVQKRERISGPWYNLHNHDAILTLSPDGSRIIGADLISDPATNERLHSVAIANFQSGEYLGAIHNRGSLLGKVVKVKIAPSMSVFGVLDEYGHLSVYRFSNGELLTIHNHVHDFDFGPTGAMLALALGDDGGSIWTID